MPARKTARNNCCYTKTPDESLPCSTTKEVTDPDTGEVTEQVTNFKCPQDSNTDYCGTNYNTLFDACYDNFKEANKNTAGTCLNAQYNSCRADWATVHEDANGDGLSDYSEQATVGVSRCYKHNSGPTTTPPFSNQTNFPTVPRAIHPGLTIPSPASHKWPNADDYKIGLWEVFRPAKKNIGKLIQPTLIPTGRNFRRGRRSRTQPTGLHLELSARRPRRRRC